MRNIQTLQERRGSAERDASVQERAADTIARLTGSMTFVYLHVVLFGIWALLNSGLLPILPKLNGSFVVLDTSASVETIFISSFVLISQNRMAAAADKRTDLDHYISLLAEQEVTKLAAMVSATPEHLGVQIEADTESDELRQDVAAGAFVDEIERHGQS